MKKIIFILLFIPIVSIYSQTITMSTYLTSGPSTTLSLIGSDGGSPARNIYGATFPIFCCDGLGEIKVQWNNTLSRWEILNDYCSVQSLYPVNAIYGFPSSPNPPDLSNGSWSDLSGCGLPTVFNGTGTQSSVLTVSEIENYKIKFSIYPNPIKNFVLIENQQNFTGNLEFTITDLTGRIVKNGNSKFNEQINIEGLTSGNYIIQIETENGVKFTEKLIKH